MKIIIIIIILDDNNNNIISKLCELTLYILYST